MFEQNRMREIGGDGTSLYSYSLDICLTLVSSNELVVLYNHLYLAMDQYII